MPAHDDDLDPLRDRLRRHWPLSGDEALREDLLDAWDRPGYHDLQHLADVLGRLAELAEAGVDYPHLPVVLAAWFHDAVYDGERDAEERSAAWAEDALPLSAGEETAAEVARLVRMTETHEPEEHDVAGCALSDADLAILAAPAARYSAYVRSVREEYSHLDDDAFALGRAQVLEHLSEKPTLFHTAPARAAWEADARANLDAELAGLRRAAS